MIKIIHLYKNMLSIIVLGLGIGLLSILPAQATLVTTTIKGTVDIVDPGGNPFGLVVGSTVTAVATYDNAVITGIDDEVVIFTGGPTSSLDIMFGGHIFTEGDDDSFLLGFPTLQFQNGMLGGIDFVQFDFTFGGSQNLDAFGIGFPLQPPLQPLFDGFAVDDFQANGDFDRRLIEGTWDLVNAQTVPFNNVVAEPTIILLFGIGLLSLFGFARRRY